MRIRIAEIKVGRRIRKELTGIDDLAASLERYGQLHPIVINRRNMLVSGRRRLAAARRLGWTTIEALVVDAADRVTRLELELEENAQRVAVPTEEVADAYARLERLRSPGFLLRLWRAIAAFFRRVFSRA
ncbi:MAG: ParB N-terminal domain-containing protein [Spirochaetales bacterium]|nr:ParB N-terminal domain-containing protein [Spirochaetales bacterium]